MRHLHDRPLSERLLYTAFLLLIGIGYLMALAYLYLSHRGHDGKPGLSMEDIVDNYYGNRSGTRIEAAIRGPMAGYIQPQDRHHVVAWLRAGAAEADYATRIRPIFAKTCLQCHSPASGLKIPDLSTYSGVRAVANVDTGVSLLSLVRLSHIHLFGIGLVLLAVGFIFRLAELPEGLKATLLAVPFASVLADILAWFLTKWDPFYAYTVVGAGALLGLALALQILIALYQLWFVRSGDDGP
jgi:mono/diheme cytochrome c family protein